MELIRKLTQAEAMAELTARRAEYVSWLEAKITERDDSYKKSEALAAQQKPIRRPGGGEYERHTRHFFWTDALWCGDISALWPEEFLGCESITPPPRAEDDSDMAWYAENEEFQVLCNDTFNEAFVKVMPAEFHDILEG